MLGSPMGAWSRLVAFALALLGCTPTTDLEGYSPPKARSLPEWLGRTRGSSVVMSRDERVAVVANRSAGVVSVFQLDPNGEAGLAGTLGALREIAFPPTAEPWAAVIGRDGDTAYVVLRGAQKVARITNLRGTPALNAEVAVGSEPTAIAMAPSGDRLFIANWAEGTISVILIAEGHFELSNTINLNEALVTSNLVGSLVPRPGLAHPRALAITDDGDNDDGDESLYATEFFSQALYQPGLDENPRLYDQARQGVVYRTRLGDANTSVITLGPVLQTGFLDSTGAVTGCFPNQLYSALAAPDRLLVSAVCASPVGPVGPTKNDDGSTNPANFKTVTHPAVFVIRGDEESPNERVVLTELLDTVIYPKDGIPADSPERRMPLIPNDLALVPHQNGADLGACLSAFGADALFCLEHDYNGWDVGAPGARYVDLEGTSPKGRLPTGVAASRHGTFALVANDNSQNVSVIDLATSSVAQVAAGTTSADAQAVHESLANKGRALFATGLDVWSFKGQAWASCETCHPDGLSDGVTWFFTRGPRRTISTAATFTGSEQRLLLWTASVDEVHDVEGIVRSVQGGTGAVLRAYRNDDPNQPDPRFYFDGSTPPANGVTTPTLNNNLNGSLWALVNDPNTPVKEWNVVEAFIRSVRTPSPPNGLDPAAVTAGRGLFQKSGCAACHGGPAWTVSRRFYTPSAATNGALLYTKPTFSPEQLSPLLGTLRMQTYDVPPKLQPLNPPGASGTALLRRFLPPATDTQAFVDYAYDPKTALEDQINCVLRSVGTFPSAAGALKGLALPAAPPVWEVRSDMMTPALGATGFNVPSLLGLSVGAPYFHAGNARTLEEAFHEIFDAHRTAVGAALPEDRTMGVYQLVQFLLSIGDDTAPETLIPGTTEPFEPDLCPPAL
jgi:DNA-binding beta-propeller fold protein YncE